MVININIKKVRIDFIFLLLEYYINITNRTINVFISMEKPKLLKFITRIYKSSFENMHPTDVYTYFVGTFPYNEYAQAMTAEDIVMVSFLLPFAGKSDILDEKYDFIKYNLFGFTIVEIDNEYSDVECPECDGNGSQECSECYGAGEEDCSECGGSGEDEEGGVCSTCDGDGKEQCDYCDGDGQINCSECGGSGSYDDYDKRDISQWFYVSYDKLIHDEFISLDEWDELNSEDYSSSRTSITLTRKQTSIDEPTNVKMERNDEFFYEFTDTPDLSKRTSGRIDIENLSDL